MQYLSQSEIVRTYLSRMFKQKRTVETSDIPIYVNYSVPFYEIDKKRIMVYDSNGLSPQYFLGDSEIIRTQAFIVIVADKDSKTAYERLNDITEYLTSINQDGEIITIRQVDDIEPIGINPNKYYLYRCSFALSRLK